MSHFYGVLKGSRGEATRCGTKKSGLSTVAASWHGSIRVTLYRSDVGRDCFVVVQEPWQGHGCTQVLAEGWVGHPVDHMPEPTDP